jgi:hypothetical protein
MRAEVGMMRAVKPVYFFAVVSLLMLSGVVLVYSRMKQGMPRGEWGGEHINMSVGEGSAKLEFDCAHGYIAGPLLVDEHGKFQLRGTFTAERGGPIRAGESQREQPATYSGEINGNKMTLILKVGDADETETFTLEKGKTARLVKCK